jgi:hypothetical protein
VPCCNHAAYHSRVVKKLLIALGVSISTGWVGLLGASAFNPASGSVAHSEIIWRVFGIPAEIAGLTTAALVVALLVALAARLAVRGLRR